MERTKNMDQRLQSFQGFMLPFYLKLLMRRRHSRFLFEVEKKSIEYLVWILGYIAHHQPRKAGTSNLYQLAWPISAAEDLSFTIVWKILDNEQVKMLW